MVTALLAGLFQSFGLVAAVASGSMLGIAVGALVLGRQALSGGGRVALVLRALGLELRLDIAKAEAKQRDSDAAVGLQTSTPVHDSSEGRAAA